MLARFKTAFDLYCGKSGTIQFGARDFSGRGNYSGGGCLVSGGDLWGRGFLRRERVSICEWILCEWILPAGRFDSGGGSSGTGSFGLGRFRPGQGLLGGDFAVSKK